MDIVYACMIYFLIKFKIYDPNNLQNLTGKNNLVNKCPLTADKVSSLNRYLDIILEKK